MVLVLEHRFYGESLPYGNDSLKLENIYGLLNVQQALEDLAEFIGFVKETSAHGVGRRNPWFTIGGSYPGAMSAWFRYKYPHLTEGALASSAVVHAILNYTQFDTIIRKATLRSGQWCTD